MNGLRTATVGVYSTVAETKSVSKERFKTATVSVCKYMDYIAAACVFMIMAVSVTNIFLRAVFKSPLTGTIDIVCIMGTVAIGLALAYSTYNKAQIAVPILVNKFSQGWQDGIDFCTNVLSLVFWVAVVYNLVLSSKEMYLKGLTTGTLNLPLYPVMLLLALGFGALCLVLVYRIYEIAGKRRP